jgi:hypothetical protein
VFLKKIKWHHTVSPLSNFHPLPSRRSRYLLPINPNLLLPPQHHNPLTPLQEFLFIWLYDSKILLVLKYLFPIPFLFFE